MKKKIENALNNFPSEIPDTFPTAMPLLDRFRKNNYRKTDSLANIEVLLIQHQLGPLLLRLKALSEEGLKPEKTWLVDIPYSTNERVREEIPKRFNIPKLQISPPMCDPLAPYTSIQKLRVEQMIYQLSDRIGRSKLLVIDDGAYFTRSLRQLEEYRPGICNPFVGRIAIVEQTTRGHRYLEQRYYSDFITNKLQASVVSVAKSKTKKDFESPFIGISAVRALIRAIEREKINLDEITKFVVIGFGPVGKAVFLAMQKIITKKRIDVIDPDLTKHQEISKLGGNPFTNIPRDKAYQIVVGCTGYSSLGLKDWECFSEKTYLFSTSSAAVEFNRKQFIDLAELYPDDEFRIVNKDELRKSGIRATVTIRDDKKDKEISFINASFPINFDGHIEHIPIEMIQATHTLLYAAGYQALDTVRFGVQPLDERLDNEILSDALKFI